MKTTKTYTAKGLLDLQLVIHAGRAWVTVPFAGGRASGYGEHCALFSTADPGLQYLLENCPEFRNGRIALSKQ